MKKRFIDLVKGDVVYEVPRNVYPGDKIIKHVVWESYLDPQNISPGALGFKPYYVYILCLECKNSYIIIGDDRDWKKTQYKRYKYSTILFTDKKSAIGYYKHSLKIRAKRIIKEIEEYRKKQYGYYIAEKNAIKVHDDIAEIVSKPLNLSDIIS